MNQRKSYIEWLRVISMCAVVFTHIGSTAHTDFPDTYFGSVGGVLFQSIVNLSHFAVPVFFMISGALLLNPAKEISVRKWFTKYVLRYCWVIIIFGWMFALLEQFFENKSFSVQLILNAFTNMLSGKSWAHMWYLYTLVGIMLILPVMRSVAKVLNDVEYRILLGILFIFTSAFPFVESITGFKLGIVFPISSVYFSYMLLGFWLDYRKQNSFPHTIILLCLIVMCAAGLIIDSHQYIISSHKIILSSYSSPVIAVYSACIFILIRKLQPKSNMAIEFLSGVSFGVYLVHMIWINLVFKYFKLDPVLPTPLTGIVLGLAVLCVSILTSWIMKRIPILKRIV